MCGHCYEQIWEQSKKQMLFCRLKTEEPAAAQRLCPCQRFCPDRDKFIPFKQEENCRQYR